MSWQVCGGIIGSHVCRACHSIIFKYYVNDISNKNDDSNNDCDYDNTLFAVKTTYNIEIYKFGFLW